MPAAYAHAYAYDAAEPQAGFEAGNVSEIHLECVAQTWEITRF